MAQSNVVDHPLSLRQPAWHVIFLCVITLKIYLLYWCYKNWRDLARQINKSSGTGEPGDDGKATSIEKDELQPVGGEIQPAKGQAQPVKGSSREGFFIRLLPGKMASFKNVSPLFRTIGMLIPHVSSYLLFTLFLGIARLHPDKDSIPARHPIVCSLVLVAVFVASAYLYLLPAGFYFLFLASAIPLAFVQHWLNRYWESVEGPGMIMRQGFSPGELIATICGALLLAFLVSYFILGLAG